jgi:hypothetical protein
VDVKIRARKCSLPSSVNVWLHHSVPAGKGWSTEGTCKLCFRIIKCNRSFALTIVIESNVVLKAGEIQTCPVFPSKVYNYSFLSLIHRIILYLIISRPSSLSSTAKLHQQPCSSHTSLWPLPLLELFLRLLLLLRYQSLCQLTTGTSRCMAFENICLMI